MIIEDIALTFVAQLGVRGIAHLLERFGSARDVFAASEQELIHEAGLRSDVARRIVRKEGFAEAERELQHCAKEGIVPISSTDAAYPDRLRFISDFPHVIYSMGDVEVLNSEHVISIVGTRRMTPYGERMCNKIVEQLSATFPDTVIVSGLAFGADAAAHRAALMYGLRTVGVIANALPAITPATNTTLAHEMLARGGAVVSEITSQTRQNGNFYIPRNRIVAGLCDGLLVVESPYGGGSLHTAQAADGYSRTVMAPPGRATDPMSAGTNGLIRSGVARMITSADDLIEELGWRRSDVADVVRGDIREMSDREALLMSLFGDSGDAVSLDVLIERSGLSAGDVSATLLDLELSGEVRQLPGKLYEKLT
ncbi:MAG: DNA-protecting protein DprA [Alistipes sp.]|nr:DNA-protecting protein DprA [Alistipes sp.]